MENSNFQVLLRRTWSKNRGKTQQNQWFSSSPKDQELEKDINKINLLRETNPEMLSAIEQGVNQEVQQQEAEEQDKSFIKMEK